MEVRLQFGAEMINSCRYVDNQFRVSNVRDSLTVLVSDRQVEAAGPTSTL